MLSSRSRIPLRASADQENRGSHRGHKVKSTPLRKANAVKSKSDRFVTFITIHVQN